MTSNDNPNQPSTQTNTGGGAVIDGNMQVGGAFAGRDRREQSDDVSGGKFHAQQQTINIYNAPAGQPAATTTASEVTAPPLLTPIPNPYRGLEAFEAEHAASYFGRTAMVAKLLAKVQSTNFVAVVGPSGSGKSSLVRAGLVTALREGNLPGSRDWQIAIIRPGDDPLRALATPLVTQIGPALQPVERLKQVRAMATGLQDGSLPIGDVLAEVRSQQPGLSRLLLIFDQFEETFTLCSDEALRRTFLQTLLTAANTPWLTILFTLRADFYGRVLEDEPFGRRVDAGLVNVLPMTDAERRAAIEQPAVNAGRRFEEGLVQGILDDIETEPGELPLLQFALTELWERQTPEGVLTHAAYAEIGAVAGAIAKRADQTLKGLQSDEQAAVRRIFTRLVRVAQPDEGSEDTKRRIGLTEMDPAMQTLVYKLADARLLVTGRDEQSGNETVEVAHEALIRGWSELKVWLNSDREFLLWRQRLRALVANWLASKADEGALLRGALLTEAEPWHKTRVDDLIEQEQRFISASRTLADREEQEREAARQRELAQAKTARNRSLIALATALAALVLALVVGWQLYDQNRKVRGERFLTEAREFKKALNATGAIQKFQQADVAAKQAGVDLGIDVNEEISDTLRYVATQWVLEGEELARKGDLTGAAEKYQAALDLKPPPDTAVYVRVPVGEFTMGSTGTEQNYDDNEKPQHQVTLDEFWMLRTEVTNAQYKECVEKKGCTTPRNSYWDKDTLARWPVTDVDWHQASQYAAWKGGRLPTEAEREKACRGTDARIYPWGNERPTATLLNFYNNEGTVTDVGTYADGQSPYGLLDIAGNVWEWTSSQHQPYPYQADDGREEPTGGALRTLRGGAFNDSENGVRCAGRVNYNPADASISVGFRLVSPGF